MPGMSSCGIIGSPPARGRGLKQLAANGRYFLVASPPARGRGLKQYLSPLVFICIMSPPARGRGLKQCESTVCNDTGRSPPARGRGLKRCTCSNGRQDIQVAPCAGAWIETVDEDLLHQAGKGSPPALGREAGPHAPPAGGGGLTPGAGGRVYQCVESPPARGRGLKHNGNV